MAFLVGIGKAAVCGVAAAEGAVAAGAAALAGNSRAARNLSRGARRCAREAAHGLEDAGRGLIDNGRAAAALADAVNPAGNCNPFLREAKLTGLAWVSAKVCEIVYEASASRPSSFRDKEGGKWSRLHRTDCPCNFDSKYLCVYQCGKDIVIGIRGTDFYDGGDLASDAALALGGVPPIRCADTEKMVVAMRRSGRFRKICLAGHSLGGCIASYVGLANGFKVHCFNPGAAPHDKIASALLHASRNCDGDVTVHRIGTDLVSAFVSSSRRVQVNTYRKKYSGVPGSAHSIRQFL